MSAPERMATALPPGTWFTTVMPAGTTTSPGEVRAAVGGCCRADTRATRIVWVAVASLLMAPPGKQRESLLVEQPHEVIAIGPAGAKADSGRISSMNVAPASVLVPRVGEEPMGHWQRQPSAPCTQAANSPLLGVVGFTLPVSSSIDR